MRDKVARVISTRERAADCAVCKRARLSGAAIGWCVDRSRTFLSAPSSTIRSAWRAIIATLLGVSLTACVTTGSPSSYMGIDLASPAPVSSVAAEVQSLARRAQAGDKHAQLELGIRFEEGNGVERDLKRAKKLYRAAAKDSSGRQWVYSPSTGSGSPGRAIPVVTGGLQPGLEEARIRLERLD